MVRNTGFSLIAVRIFCIEDLWNSFHSLFSESQIHILDSIKISFSSTQHLKLLIILLIEIIYFKGLFVFFFNIAEKILSKLFFIFSKNSSFYRHSLLPCVVAQKEEMLLTVFHLIYSICHCVLCAKNGLLFKFVYSL